MPVTGSMREMTMSAVSSASALMRATSAPASSGKAGRMTPPGAGPCTPGWALLETPEIISRGSSLRPRIGAFQPREEGLGARPFLLGEGLLGRRLGGGGLAAAAGLEPAHRRLGGELGLAADIAPAQRAHDREGLVLGAGSLARHGGSIAPKAPIITRCAF